MAEELRISHSGLVARSPEGHAAKGMQIKGQEELWIEIQAHTFRNWVNDQLKPVGLAVLDLERDFSDGVKLITLVEILQKRTIKKVIHPINQHQCLENVQVALNAIANDGIKLVNIGNEDIVNGNLKLILGLIWSLIIRYQIGRSRFPPKKLMLAWLRAVLPEVKITNFTSDWSSGVYLTALLDYCKPGLYPHWRELDPNNGLLNCRNAMEIAQQEFDIPMVLDPEYMSSPYMDELSGMTYLSYFMKENGPGYKATLSWVQKEVHNKSVTNFTTDWNDGLALCELVKGLGGPIPGYKDLNNEPENWEKNLTLGIQGGEKLNIEPLLKPKDLGDPNCEHLGTMAYVARYQWVPRRKMPCERLKVTADSKSTRVNNPFHFRVEILSEDVDPTEVTAYVEGPNGKVDCRFHMGHSGGHGTFVPTQVGMHQIVVNCEGEPVVNCPVKVRVLPDVSKIMFSGIDPCAIGSIVEVLINSNGAGGGIMEVVAVAPSGREMICPVSEDQGVYTATFQPDEAGEWKIAISYDEEHIQGSPFTCYVFDPHGVKLMNLEGAVPREPFTFICDATDSGWGDVKLDVVYKGKSIHHTIESPITESNRISKVTFVPPGRGKYKIYMYCNGNEVRGSPVKMYVQMDSDSHSKKHRKSKRETTLEKSIINHINVPTVADIKKEQTHLNLTSSPPPPTSSPYNSLPRPDKLTSPQVVKEVSKQGSTLERNYKLHNISDELINMTSSLNISSLHDNLLSSNKEISSNSKSFLKFGTPEKTLSPTPVHASTLIESNVNKLDKSNTEYQSTEKHMKSSSYYNETSKSESSYSNIHNFRNSSNYQDETDVGLHRTGGRLLGMSRTQSLISELSMTEEDVKLVPVNRQAAFSIQAPGLNVQDINIKIKDPSALILPYKMVENSNKEIMVQFTPHYVGEHIIDVEIHNEPVPASPLRCFAFNSKEIKFVKIPVGKLNTPVEFEIDGSKAGAGNLEISVNGGHVTSYVKDLGNQRFLASFIPHKAIQHKIEMLFNKEVIPGSPWFCEIMDPDAHGNVVVTTESFKHVPSGKMASFEVHAPAYVRDDIEISITGPNQQPVTFRLIELSTGIYRVEFNPQYVGSYMVDVILKSQKANGSPFIARAYDSTLIRVSDVPSGVIGQPCQFRVDASQAGEGQLEISINDGDVQNQVQVLGGGRCLVSFTPEIVENHRIDIKFNGEPVPGCPFICHVTDKSRVKVNLRHLELLPIEKPASFPIQVDGEANKELAVSVRSLNHSAVPVKVSGNPQSGYTAEFVPKEVGAHTISVEYNNLPVTGTPFTCKVYDAKRVYVSPMPKGAIGKNLQFIVDASNAGEGNLEITISAKGRNIPTEVHPQGNARFNVSFIPLEPIEHVVNISFNKEPVPGAPFIANVYADPNRILVAGQSFSSTAVGKTSYFSLSNVTGSVEDIEVNIEGPTGNVPAQVKDNGDQTFIVEFIPKLAGEHRIHILHSGENVPGSPFSCKVYDVNQIKVRETTRGVIGKPVTFLVETSQAGPGNLEVTVNNGQVQTSAQSQGNHTYAISFTPKESKPHVIELKFNGENVPGSPFKCNILDASRATLTGDGLEKVSVGNQAVFYVASQGSLQDINVQVFSPTRRKISSHIKQIGDGKFAVEYRPQEVGDHTIEVHLADVPVPGSPYLVKAYDAGKIRVTDVTYGVVGKPVYFTIDASQAGAGNLEIIVSVNGRNVPNRVESEGNARFRVNFKPQESEVHILSVKFNGKPVPGSPFYCKIGDASQILISGEGLKMSALSHPAQFTIDPRGAEVGDCIVIIVSPNGKNIPATINKSRNGTFSAEFQPDEVGPHSVSVLLDHEPLPGSPFTCNVYDVNKVHVSGLGSAKIGEPVTFTVDASQAGEGTLELVITTAKSSVKAEVTAQSRGLYDVTFVPTQAIPHNVNITFNEEDIPGSPFKCEVQDLDAKEMSLLKRTESKKVFIFGEGLKEITIGKPSFVGIDCKGMDGDVEMRVTSSNDYPIITHVHKIKSGLYRGEYTVEESGSYKVEIFHKNRAVTKEPIYVEAVDPNKVKILGVEEGIINRDCRFRVDSSQAGRGNLLASVHAAGRDVKYSLRDLGWGLYEVLFTPTIAASHQVDLKYNGVSVPKCPFEIPVGNPYIGKEVTASGYGLYQSKSDCNTSFVIHTNKNSTKEFDVVVVGPGGTAVPIKCYQQKDGNLKVEFMPVRAGNHKIEVYHHGNHVKGSPFQCFVYDPSKVFLEDLSTTTYAINERIELKVNTKSAGSALLTAGVQGPQDRKVTLHRRSVPDGESLEFSPLFPGRYRLYLMYGEDDVPGSPVVFNVEEEGTARVYGPGLSSAQVGRTSSFKIDARGLVGHPSVQVDGPDSVVKCLIEKEEEGLYLVSYTPQETGIFDVKVTWNGREVPGSPFHPKVVDPNKVRVIGGWDSLVGDDGKMELQVHEEKKITFDVNDAGPGKLSAEVVGPQRTVDVKVEKSHPSRYKVMFTPSEQGEHSIYIKLNDFELPKTPLSAHAYVNKEALDHTRVTLTGKGLTMAKCGEEAEFLIDGSEAGPGSPEVSLAGVKNDIKVHTQEIGRNVFKATYNPSIPGTYLLNVLWSDRQVKNCPIKVHVTSNTDAAKVVCSGDGLKGGSVGKDIKSFIDTRKAGPGELSAQCVGPHKIAYSELYDHSDGTFTLNVKPQEAGRHTLTIKYGGEHVPGSPYYLKIAGAPDPSKVRVYGPGIEPGVLATFQSRFICDTRGAGAGQLTVRIRGPKGAFRVEMQRESQKDRTILCKYDPTEPGDYRVEVKWSGENVPGSPFVVLIFDTQDELNRYLQGNYSPHAQAPPLASSNYYGSLGYSGTYGQLSWRGSQAQL